MQTDARPLVDGLKPLANAYDLILCDVWGVLHNGLDGLPCGFDAWICSGPAAGGSSWFPTPLVRVRR